MLEQRDHRGKPFTISDRPERETLYEQQMKHQCRRAEQLEREAQRELRLLDEAKAVAGPEGNS